MPFKATPEAGLLRVGRGGRCGLGCLGNQAGDLGHLLNRC